MKPIHIPFYLTVLLTLLILGVSAQEQLSLRERANQYFYEYRYSQAIPLYLKVLEGKKPILEDLERLAESYRQIDDYKEAEAWYGRLVEDPACHPDNLLNYAEVLKQNEHYVKARKVLLNYAAKTGDMEKVTIEVAGCDSALVWMANPTLYQIRNEKAVNTPLAEFSVFPIGKKVYYTGEPDSVTMDKLYGWTGNAYLRVYTANNDNENHLREPVVAGR